MILVFCYITGVIIKSYLNPMAAPAHEVEKSDQSTLKLVLTNLAPPLLIVAALGSILAGIATPTEAAGVGAFGAILLALSKGKNKKNLTEAVEGTTEITLWYL